VLTRLHHEPVSGLAEVTRRLLRKQPPAGLRASSARLEHALDESLDVLGRPPPRLVIAADGGSPAEAIAKVRGPANASLSLYFLVFQKINQYKLAYATTVGWVFTTIVTAFAIITAVAFRVRRDDA
jgi:hypothetical protein